MKESPLENVCPFPEVCGLQHSHSPLFSLRSSLNFRYTCRCMASLLFPFVSLRSCYGMQSVDFFRPGHKRRPRHVRIRCVPRGMDEDKFTISPAFWWWYCRRLRFLCLTFLVLLEIFGALITVGFLQNLLSYVGTRWESTAVCYVDPLPIHSDWCAANRFT